MFREGTANARYYWPMAMDREDLIGGGWDRAPRMKVPRWWLAELTRLIDAWLENVGGKERTLAELAVEVSKKAGRTEEWTHGTISKCRDGKLVTWDLVVALCAFFPGLPEPLYFPRSLDEGRRLAKDPKESRVNRRGDFDGALNRLDRQSGEDQSPGVQSSNDEEAGSGRVAKQRRAR